MSKNLAAALQEIADTAAEAPGAIEPIVQLARQIRETAKFGQEAYRRSHWGQRGRGSLAVGSVPNAALGLAELGRLAEVTYLTKKGRDGSLVAYVHRFGVGAVDASSRGPGRYGDPRTLPMLAFTYDESPSGLVIVRDRGTTYTVTEHGIER
jgi:hypothetical protein